MTTNTHFQADICQYDPRGPFIVLGIEFNRDEDLPSFILSETATEAKIDWELNTATSRSKVYQVNAFRYFVPTILRAHAKSQEDEFNAINRVMKFVHDWSENYSYDSDDPLGGELTNNFAWYDMAVGMRAAMIGYLLSKTSCGSGFSKAHKESLSKLARDHANYLKRQDLWSWHSNHGYYQSLGLFAMVAQAPEAFEDAKELRQIAVERTRWYLDRTVSEHGVHLEHSPLYHIFIYRSVAEAAPWLDPSNVDEAAIAHKYELMQTAMAATFQPNGVLVPLGDSRSAEFRLELSYNDETAQSLTPALLAQYERSKDNAKPAFKQSFLADSTGLIINKEWEGTQNSYFSLTAQYHSTVHKQVDDMSIFWAENSLPILTDHGRYGYEGQTKEGSSLRNEGFLYSDPKRIYVESTHAHNVIEIDKKSDNRRKTPQYQSAVIGSTSKESTLVVECERLREQLVGHNRVVIHRPGEFVLCIDEVASLIEKNREITQWWQFHPAWRTKPGGKGNSLRLSYFDDWLPEYTEALNGKSVTDIAKLAKLSPAPDYEIGVVSASSEPITWQSHFGAKKPRMMGWTSLSPLVLEASPAISFSSEAPVQSIGIATFIGKISPDSENPILTIETRSNETLRLKLIYKNETSFWDIERTKGTLKVTETPEDAESMCLEVERKPSARLIQSNNIIKARAHIKMGHDPETVFEFYDAAIDPVWADAAIEAAEYAQKENQTKKELNYLRIAAESGDGNGATMLGRTLLKSAETEDDFKEVEDLLIAGAGNRIRSAYAYLGKLYERDGPLNSPEKAENAYKQGALMGHAPSGGALGQLLLNQSRIEEALPWMEMGMAGGNAATALKFGNLFKTGEGIDVDLEEAMRGYRIAMAAGSRTAFYFAAQVLSDKNYNNNDPVEANSLLEEAAKRGVAHARFDIGIGKISAGNTLEGIKDIKEAANNGSNKAIKYITNLQHAVSNPD